MRFSASSMLVCFRRDRMSSAIFCMARRTEEPDCPSRPVGCPICTEEMAGSAFQPRHGWMFLKGTHWEARENKPKQSSPPPRNGLGH
ncbi:unnamed protein product [Nyctereutes procyonoides]|uniref:(raccoon dog) hypothetical protein n=1 Tax=Nyctereutes procyonoides TaxID=34880 RepID=A0A811YB33_NYCPR|nr:unnamed protein product [Nyctereutes procyonoides]